MSNLVSERKDYSGPGQAQNLRTWPEPYDPLTFQLWYRVLNLRAAGTVITSVADPYPGSRAFLTPESGIRDG